jgi:hypothetical protein
MVKPGQHRAQVEDGAQLTDGSPVATVNAELDVLRLPAYLGPLIILRQYSAGRLWIVLPARLPRFWLVTGVVSGAWVPA